MEFHSGDPLFEFDASLQIVAWNRAAEELTGTTAAEAIGRYCWDVLGAVDDRGAMVCHAGCSNARLVREGWPVRTHELLIRTREGRRRVALSTIVARGGGRPRFLHLMRNELPAPEVPEIESVPTLTPRQQQVLELLGQGVPAKAIASRFGLSETTVRNHIRAILLELGCHSQLEALAKARRFGIA